MSGLVILSILFVGFVVLDILAQAFGADTRTDFEESPASRLVV